MVCRTAREHDADITGASVAAQRLLHSVQGIGAGGDLGPPRPPVWERVPLAVGDKVFAGRSGIYGVVGFFGQILMAGVSLARRPSRFPFKALVHQMELVGVTALPDHRLE